MARKWMSITRVFELYKLIWKIIAEYSFLGFAVFFEFKHYKPKKKLTSTKCWAFMERDEVKEGPVVIEL